MGSEVGKRSRTDALGGGPIPDVGSASGVPGKGTRTEKLPVAAADIGDPYVEGRGHCDKPGSGCFLTPVQRDRLVDAFQKEVQSAAKEYSVALAEIRFDTLVQKEEDLVPWVGMLIDVIGTLATDGIMAGFKLLQKASAREVTTDLGWMLELQAGGHGHAESPSVKELVQAVDPSAVSAIARAGVSLAKKEIRGSGKAPGDEKALKLDYVDRLQEAAAVAWEHQWQDPPGTASDAELILLFHAFKAKNGHTTPRYKIALEDKIARFVASPASRVGRGRTWKGRDPQVSDMGTAGFVMRDLKVVWVQVDAKLPPRLYYYKLDAADAQNAHTIEHPEIPMVWGQVEDRFRLVNPVEEEFVEVAIARHREVWRAEPELKQVDKSQVPRPEYPVNYLPQYVPQLNPDFRPVGTVGKPDPTPAVAPAAPAPLPAGNRVSPSGLPRLQLGDVPWSPMSPMTNGGKS